MNEWIHKWMNERASDLVCEWGWMDGWMDGWVIEWVSERVSGMNEWIPLSYIFYLNDQMAYRRKCVHHFDTKIISLTPE